ncbi:MAG: oligosaccharide flippase family protein [Alphaproteobacteria bacterium]|nr:oligosaccharide flippase family protein [Alphaproteobacteria bacterium]
MARPLLPSVIRRLYDAFGHYVAGLAVRGIEVVGKLGLYVLAAAVLGAHGAGLYFLCITWVGLASTIARMGLERAITRHVAAELAVGDGRAARDALLAGFLWTTVGGAAAAALTWLVADPAARLLFREPDLGGPLAIAALVLVPQTTMVVAAHALTGLKQGVASLFVQSSLWPVLTLGALVAGADSVERLLLAMAGAMTLCTAIGLVLLARGRALFRTQPDAGAPPGERLPGLWRTALPLGVVEMVQVSLGSIPVLVLGMFAEAADVGAFSVANRISLLIWVVIISIGTVAAPTFAELHRRGEQAALRAANRRVRLVTVAAGLPVIAAMLLLPETLLRLIGAGFDSAAPALVVLAVGQLVNCLLASQDVVLAMTGHGRWLRLLNLMQLAVCIVLAAVLIPPFGMMGAAVLTAICIAQGAIGTTLAVQRLMPYAL